MALSEYLAALEPVKPGMPIGEAVTARRLNAIMECIRALARGENIVSGPGTLVRRNPTGAVITSTARGNGRGDGYVPPFTCNVSGGVVKITKGTVNGEFPTIGGVGLDETPAPSVTLVAGLNTIALKTVGHFDESTGAETIDRAIVENLGSGSMMEAVTVDGWVAYTPLTFVTMATTEGGLAQVGEAFSYVTTNLNVRNFGPTNFYFG